MPTFKLSLYFEIGKIYLKPVFNHTRIYFVLRHCKIFSNKLFFMYNKKLVWHEYEAFDTIIYATRKVETINTLQLRNFVHSYKRQNAHIRLFDFFFLKECFLI